MNIIITQWALDSYLELKIANVFSSNEYGKIIRPDVLSLRDYPDHIRFSNGKFWSPASEPGYGVISDGYKMKWHNIGNGKVQLRLPVGILNRAYLCAAYIKRNDKYEKRQLAKFKTYLQLIRRNQHIERGGLS